MTMGIWQNRNEARSAKTSHRAEHSTAVRMAKRRAEAWDAKAWQAKHYSGKNSQAHKAAKRQAEQAWAKVPNRRGWFGL
jgi:hypothetical protein